MCIRDRGSRGAGENSAPLLPRSPAPLLLFLALAALLAWPYLRFRLAYPTDLAYHLRSLDSYWFRDIAAADKLAEFARRYLYGLSPAYWFQPNDHDLIRHRMGESLGHMRVVFLPLVVLGVVVAVGRGLRKSPGATHFPEWVAPSGVNSDPSATHFPEWVAPEGDTLEPAQGATHFRKWVAPERGAPERVAPAAAYRVVLLALLAAPVGAALVDVAITRVLSVVVPVTLLIGIGIDWLLTVVSGQWAVGSETAEPTPRSSPATRPAPLATHHPPLATHHAPPATRHAPLATRLSTLIFILLALMSLGTLRYALAEGPRWYSDYTMGGMQYGAAQLFALIEQRLAADPATEIILTPNWANGADMFPRFFLSDADQQRVRTLNVDAFLAEPRPLTPDMLFIMMPDEVERAQASGKFAAVAVEETVAYPDGRPGFLLARLAYAPNVAEVFAAELEALRQPVTETITLDGQPVTVTHTRFEAGQLADLFDGDTFTLVRHIAGNPVSYSFVFDAPRPVGGLAADFGTMDVGLTVTLTPPDGAPVTITQEFRGLGPDPHVEMPFPGAPPLVAEMTVEIRDLNAGEDVKIHVRELRLTSE